MFYANIVGVNHTLFIPVESTDLTSVLKHISTVAYSKTWLQFDMCSLFISG